MWWNGHPLGQGQVDGRFGTGCFFGLTDAGFGVGGVERGTAQGVVAALFDFSFSDLVVADEPKSLADLLSLEPGEQLPTPIELVASLHLETHAGSAMLFAARFDNSLRFILGEHMPNAGATLSEKLFEHPGPLSAFSSKIDVAYALGYITNQDRRALHAIRLIRNEFAHSDSGLHFEDEALSTNLAKLPLQKDRLDGTGTKFSLFLTNVLAIHESLTKALERAATVHVLRSDTSPSSPEKSE